LWITALTTCALEPPISWISSDHDVIFVIAPQGKMADAAGFSVK
jgi:hypothetical protein